MPPSSEEAELGALGCLFIAPSAQELDHLLAQLRPAFFWDIRRRELFIELVRLREEGHALDHLTFLDWLKGRNKLEEVGGYSMLSEISRASFSVATFSTHLESLRQLHARRQCLKAAAELESLSRDPDFSTERVKGLWDKAMDTAQRSSSSAPLISVWTIAEAKRYVPDPKTYLVGEGMLTKGELAVLAGPPSSGKSMLATSLGLALARGHGTWQGEVIRRQARTFLLQSENHAPRLQKELLEAPEAANDFFRVSLPCFMQFQAPAFRAELRRIWEAWPFDLLIIDNLTDVIKADAREDVLEGLENIFASLPGHPDRPAVLILAHMRKQRGGEKWIPKSGRALQAELAGSYALAAKARTVWFLQPWSDDMQDDRCVFDCGKCNNDKPQPMSAWRRRFLEFEPAPGEDLEAWLLPPTEGQPVLTEEGFRQLFLTHGPTIDRRELMAILQREYGTAASTAYRYTDPTDPRCKFRDHLWITDQGKLAWK